MKVRGGKIRRHLLLVDQPITDPSRDPEGQWDEGASRGGVTAGWKRPPWPDPLPFCPTPGCNAPFVDGAQTCSCDWGELEQAA